jgi:hypothetical protein
MLTYKAQGLNMTSANRYRLLTRGDLDGLICGVLLKHLDMVDTIELIDDPGMLQQHKISVGENDIITNLPYVPGVHLAIDHHVSETIRLEETPRRILDPNAPSAARVVHTHFGGRSRFPDFFDEMMAAVDKADSGRFSRDEILRPDGWVLLNFLVDQRSHIEPWGPFRLAENEFKLLLIDLCGQKTIHDILAIQDCGERADCYFAYQEQYESLVKSAAAVHRNVLVLDFRHIEKIYPGNRFMPYAFYPECNLSLLIRYDPKHDKVTFSAGKSILNTTSDMNIGKLLLAYNGGGHAAAGACRVSAEKADQVLSELIDLLSDSHP